MIDLQLALDVPLRAAETGEKLSLIASVRWRSPLQSFVPLPLSRILMDMTSALKSGSEVAPAPLRKSESVSPGRDVRRKHFFHAPKNRTRHSLAQPRAPRGSILAICSSLARLQLEHPLALWDPFLTLLGPRLGQKKPKNQLAHDDPFVLSCVMRPRGDQHHWHWRGAAC